MVPADVLKDYLLATQPVSVEALTGRRMAEAEPAQVQLAQAMEAAGQEGEGLLRLHVAAGHGDGRSGLGLRSLQRRKRAVLGDALARGAVGPIGCRHV